MVFHVGKPIQRTRVGSDASRRRRENDIKSRAARHHARFRNWFRSRLLLLTTNRRNAPRKLKRRNSYWIAWLRTIFWWSQVSTDSCAMTRLSNMVLNSAGWTIWTPTEIFIQQNRNNKVIELLIDFVSYSNPLNWKQPLPTRGSSFEAVAQRWETREVITIQVAHIPQRHIAWTYLPANIDTHTQIFTNSICRFYLTSRNGGELNIIGGYIRGPCCLV